MDSGAHFHKCDFQVRRSFHADAPRMQYAPTLAGGGTLRTPLTFFLFSTLLRHYAAPGHDPVGVAGHSKGLAEVFV